MKNMTKKELIAALDHFGDDDEVFVKYPSKDYWDTQLVRPVRRVTDDTVSWSEYHTCYQLNGEEEDDENPNKFVIVL